MIKREFYNEIFEKEKEWEQRIEKNLLNIVYCNLSLKPFYQEKKQILEDEIKFGGNQIIKQIIQIMENLIKHIDILNEQYRNSKPLDVQTLLPLFLTSQMNNFGYEKKVTNNSEKSELDRLRLKKQIMNQIIFNSSNTNSEEPDYVYEDFPEEMNRTK